MPVESRPHTTTDSPLLSGGPSSACCSGFAAHSLNICHVLLVSRHGHVFLFSSSEQFGTAVIFIMGFVTISGCYIKEGVATGPL